MFVTMIYGEDLNIPHLIIYEDNKIIRKYDLPQILKGLRVDVYDQSYVLDSNNILVVFTDTIALISNGCLSKSMKKRIDQKVSISLDKKKVMITFGDIYQNQILDIATWKITNSAMGHGNFTLSSDGSMVLEHMFGMIALYYNNGEVIHKKKITGRFCLSRDFKYLGMMDGSLLRLFDFEKDKILSNVYAKDILSFSPDGKHIMVLLEDSKIAVFDLEGKQKYTSPFEEYQKAEFISNDKLIVYHDHMKMDSYDGEFPVIIVSFESGKAIQFNIPAFSMYFVSGNDIIFGTGEGYKLFNTEKNGFCQLTLDEKEFVIAANN